MVWLTGPLCAKRPEGIFWRVPGLGRDQWIGNCFIRHCSRRRGKSGRKQKSGKKWLGLHRYISSLFLCQLLFPEMDGIVHPAFGIGSRTDAEPMSGVPIQMKFRIYARRVQCRDPALHHTRGGYGVIKADHSKGWGIVLRVAVGCVRCRP